MISYKPLFAYKDQSSRYQLHQHVYRSTDRTGPINDTMEAHHLHNGNDL